MSSFAFLVGGILPYVAVVVFAVGMAYRLNGWWKAKQPGKMTLFPAEEGTTFRRVLAETFFFPSLFKGDRILWGFSWFFHATLALVFVGHLRVFTGLIDSVLMSIGMTPAAIGTMSSTSGAAAGIVLLATAVLLLFRRFTVDRARQITNGGDFFALVLILSIIASGNVMRFGAHFDLAQTRQWTWGLLTFAPAVPLNAAFLVHALLAQLLFIYIPFSKILHFGGIFFTQALIKRR